MQNTAPPEMDGKGEQVRDGDDGGGGIFGACKVGCAILKWKQGWIEKRGQARASERKGECCYGRLRETHGLGGTSQSPRPRLTRPGDES